MPYRHVTAPDGAELLARPLTVARRSRSGDNVVDTAPAAAGHYEILTVTGSTTMETGGVSMMRTIYSSICGALIFIVALIPMAILIMDKTGF